jgi:hypothetical protein
MRRFMMIFKVMGPEGRHIKEYYFLHVFKEKSSGEPLHQKSSDLRRSSL